MGFVEKVLRWRQSVGRARHNALPAVTQTADRGPHLFAVEPLEPRLLLSGVAYPVGANVVNLATEYGVSPSDSAAVTTSKINQAFYDHPRWHTFYLPDGTYQVNDTLNMRQTDAHSLAGTFTTFQGQSADGTIIKLVDGSGLDGPVLTTGTFGSADLFHNHVRDVTIDIGSNNDLADGLVFFANNMGSIRNVDIVSQDGQGNYGVSLLYANNGPFFIENLSVDGFDIGIHAGDRLMSHTMESVTLRNQDEYGIYNDGQVLNIRKLDFAGDVVAIHNGGEGEIGKSATLTLLDSTLTGTGGASSLAAVINRTERCFLRNVDASGWNLAVDNQQYTHTGNPDDLAAGYVPEYVYATVEMLFDSPTESINLPMPELSHVPITYAPPSEWVSITDFGAVAGDSGNDGTAVQAAIDSMKPGGSNYGKSTLYFPFATDVGRYRIDSWVDVSGPVDHIIGMNTFLRGQAGFRAVDEAGVETSDTVIFNGLNAFASGTPIALEANSDVRTVRISSSADMRISVNGGNTVLIDDFVGNLAVTDPAAEIYAWQLDTEPPMDQIKIHNPGATMVVFGLKTEKAGVVARTDGGGTTEVLGAFIYPGQNEAMDYNMVEIVEASPGDYSGFFGVNLRQLNWLGSDMRYVDLVSETRDGETRVWHKEGVWNSAYPVPAYSGYAPAATVEARHVFYNDSAFDGDAGPSANDDDAIAPDKEALLPGGQASFANYTSYHKGVNGVMIDIAGLADPAGLSTADFAFTTGNDDDPSAWDAAPAPSSVTVRSGAGAGGSDRVTLIWASNDHDGTVDANEAVAKAWLEVTLQANATTGLLDADVFYFGNAVGETGDSTSDAFVNAVDGAGVREHPRSGRDPAPIDYPWDINRDALVNVFDGAWVREHPTSGRNDLNLIAPPVPEDGPLGVFEAAEDIGTVGATGSSSQDSGIYTLEGSGWDIWSTSDAFHYLHEGLTGDGEIVARVTSVENTDEWAKAGVMFRDSTAADAPFVMVAQRPDNQVTMQWRDSTGGSAGYTGSLVGGTTSVKYLKLIRSSDVFTGYYSIDGTSWAEIATHTTDLGITARVGLSVTSHNNATLATATFDNVLVTPNP
jgi:hypothetical protein